MSLMYDEICQQPSILSALLHQERESVQRIAAELRGRDIDYVVMAARGTSDNAARYGKYLFGSKLGLQVALATPSLFTIYDEPPQLRNALVLAISQSGQSEDIVSVLREARRQEIPTISITNAPESPLAAQSDYLVNIRAGEERSVAATKSYTAQLASLALLACEWAGAPEMVQDLFGIPELVRKTLELDGEFQRAADHFTDAAQSAVIGRGFNYSTAFEIALKLKELCYLPSEPYSPADFLHGPIALLDPGFPAIIIAPSGATLDNLIQFTAEMREKGASPLIISDDEQALSRADSPLRLPEAAPEWLSPLVTIVPGQFFAFHLAAALGLDPDEPRGLSKVTSTR